jgi:hypothetical protein
LEKLFRSQGVKTTGCAIAVARPFASARLSSSSFVFRLCASLISRLSLVIMVLQRLSVIDIFLILIYYLYKKGGNGRRVTLAE